MDTETYAYGNIRIREYTQFLTPYGYGNIRKLSRLMHTEEEKEKEIQAPFNSLHI